MERSPGSARCIVWHYLHITPPRVCRDLLGDKVLELGRQPRHEPRARCNAVRVEPVLVHRLTLPHRLQWPWPTHGYHVTRPPRYPYTLYFPRLHSKRAAVAWGYSTQPQLTIRASFGSGTDEFLPALFDSKHIFSVRMSVVRPVSTFSLSSWASWADRNLRARCWFILARGATPSTAR
jgi:hypothetical protein